MDPDRTDTACSQSGYAGAIDRVESRGGISHACQSGDPQRCHRARAQGTLSAFGDLLRSSRGQCRLPLHRGSPCRAKDTFAKRRPERKGPNSTYLVKTTKFTTLSEAVSALVKDGDTVALEGFTHLIPFAAGHEIIRQRKRDLTLVRMTPDLVYDQLIGAGCARKLVFSWGGNPGVGSLHRLRDAIEHGWPAPLVLEEHTHAGMVAGYAAGAAGLPFAVFRGYLGVELASVNPNIRFVDCPFTGERLAA